MKHKVTCMDCGKTERIEVERGKKIHSGWAYYGKIDINACQTSKYFYRIPEGKTLLDDEWIRVKNSCYDPKVKRKYVEMWSCPECQRGEKHESV